MENYPFNPTPEQRANLERLAAHLDLGVTNLEFDMAQYQSDCGTVGCACGHGPSLGIAKHFSENFLLYAERVFGAPVGTPEKSWMFSGGWAVGDNSPRGAAARIRYALKHGIPENEKKQRWGRATLSYTVPDRVEGPAAIKAREVAT